jgi:Secretion system C-terminal sorting domain
MRTLLISLFIACCSLVRAEGCNGPGIRLMNYSNTYGGNLATLYLPVGTTYTVYALGNMSCFYPLMRLRLFRNDQLLVDNDSLCCQSFALPLGAYEGTYKVEVTISQHGLPWPRTWTYTIVNNPVSISQLPDINKSISCFVDPSAEKLVVKSSEDEISNVQLLNLEGRIIFEVAPNSNQTSFPIGELPGGIYIVKVMLLNQRPAIKKILIEK